MKEMQQIVNKIKEADAILIGASNGLSITEGIHLFADNTAFSELFGDFRQKYGLRNILQGMMTRWPSEEEKWAFWSRLIHHYCGKYEETPVMRDLKTLIGDKDYFILTSNGECHFEACGFAEEKIYELEGNWLTMQCANACHNTLYPTRRLAKSMAESEKNGRVAADLIPHCPRCGAPMEISMAAGAPYLAAEEGRARYDAFLRKYHQKRFVILELGIGFRNRLIKAPLMSLAAREPNAVYVTINLGEIYISEDILDKSFGLDGSLSEKLAELRKIYSGESQGSMG